MLFSVTVPTQQDIALKDPCIPSPCGPYAECQNIGGLPSCACLSTYIGSPPNCRPECTVNSDCSSNNACIQQKCKDPCPGSCGIMSECKILDHIPICFCVNGYTGDPFRSCYPQERKFFYISHEITPHVTYIPAYIYILLKNVSLQPNHYTLIHVQHLHVELMQNV